MRRKSSDDNSSQSPVMILALKLLCHLVQRRLLRIDAHGEDARSILRLVSYKSSSDASAEAADLFRCILNQEDTDLSIFAKQFSDAVSLVKEPKANSNIDMILALLSVLSPCNRANRVGANVAIVATERAADVQPLHLPPGGIRYDKPVRGHMGIGGAGRSGTTGHIAIEQAEKQPSLLRQVSVTPAQDDEDMVGGSTSSEGEGVEEGTYPKFADLRKGILSNWDL